MEEQTRLTDPTADPVAAEVLEVMEVFATELPGVRFPNLDSDVFSDAADGVRRQAEHVDAARRTLDEARAQLEAQRGALAQLAERGVAYAKIYAADKPELGARLEALTISRKAQAAPKKTRRRRKRAPEPETAAAAAAETAAELPLDPPALRMVGTGA